MKRQAARPVIEPSSKLLDIVRTLFAELHRQAGREGRISLDSSLDRDLGFDSLARVELLSRIHRAFGIDLPEDILNRAETPRDLLDALLRAAQGTERWEFLSEAPTLESAEGEAADASTLLEVLDWHVRRQPERIQIIARSDSGVSAVSGRSLAQASEEMAAGLQSRGLEPGQTVAIMLPTCPEYFSVYLGILLAGGIPVPIYPPARLAQVEEHVRRHVGILSNAGTVLLVTVPEGRAVSRLLQAHVPSLRWVVSTEELRRPDAIFSRVPVTAEDVAFIQYTSGSTGDPKGVALTHANLLANVRAMGKAIGVRPDDVFVSWLPLYHDMGLIGAWLGTLYFGIPLVVMSPLAFLARPVRWLQAISAYRGTLSAAPNFAYELCVKKIEDEELAGLDLSSWRLAFNGAEAVLPETLTRFRRRFAPIGFRTEALMPVYGLAENSVGLAFPPPGRGPIVDCVQREYFSRTGRALPAAAEEASPLCFISCGRPLPGHELRVVDASGHELPEREEGRVEFRGPSATQGYFNNPQATSQLFHDGWLDSGDRGYIAGGEIFLTGRAKDMIIRGGRNIYPHEVEEVVGEIPGVRKGCVVVFGSPDPASGTERLVVLAETRESDEEKRQRLREGINAVVVEVLGEPADELVLVPPGTVLKTSSGKLRRAATRALFEAGLTDEHKRAGWLQVIRLAAGALIPQLQRWAAGAGEGAFAAWAWSAFYLVMPFVWLATVLTPHPSRAWAVGRSGARLLIRLTGTPFSVSGLEHLPRGSPCVLVANHASYIDGIVLLAALPEHFVFVAKRELSGQFFARLYLQHLGAEVVERFTARESVQDAGRLEEVLRAGHGLVFFPEGTFTRVTGLQPFRLGAFLVAANTGIPVVPVAISGARSVLRDGQWWPRRGAIKVMIGAPLMPAADARNAFAAAVVLRDAARAHILRHCGEPDIQQ
ncbi:1-acyl-sn-glycerol-3-phosphate acyltransferases [Syntrophus gentianae]|uniref:1-acyl-sn-glycerol-3-phosphate acyltransferases n=1 Tax=Syntrophus gentianae TaxID=43775 RepID=A0A1H7UIW1_9BACT|nr:AMP-binding protein [Syntrophus gentianae]SEL96598.1 1-acyl-sn-glycerol-3-phosphate acyltransferases [Syntrophus gentianae]